MHRPTRSAPADTARIALRDLRPDEAGLLDTLMAGLSPRSRYLRFHTPTPALSTRMRRALLDVDGHDRVALVAETDAGTPVGIARAIRDHRHPDEAEIAVAVVDAWHRRGVGRRLLTALAERARAGGVRRLTARVLPENAAALGLVRDLFPVTVTRRDDDALVLTAVLDTGRPDDWTITMDDILADLAA
ncbi:GNAT family N-acetyltransferase [Pseudonocardia sp. C8]|uniref:GNAT family N-acetyltransferase n=1 Tax=Pseudonocardia sp. C8 TaxID=2762759 RepID=UPI0016424997|nr:GNAT family N-acetyltransferase [Pseudonocardia sp. C8]MBC3191017.1 GNAT family N-acetyltransferase [Pseudonocardia sp. C8]